MTYKTYLVMLVISAVGSWALTPLAIRLAIRWGAVDQPGGRKVHLLPMPRLGGLAVFLGFFLPWIGLYFIHNPVSERFRNFETLFGGLVIGATSMLLLGIYDDIKGANALTKFSIQILVSVVLFFFGYSIDEVQNPWGGMMIVPVWVSLPVTVLWLVGVTNAINLLDGIDGLVSGVTAVLATSLAVINVLSNEIVPALLTICLAGACLGFLLWNHAPARIFLGDSGSLTIGMVLACISVITLFDSGSKKASPLLSVPFILFSLPVVDTFRVMLTRIAKGGSPFKADKNHVHHHLLALGMNHRQAAWTLYVVAAGTGAFAVALSRMPMDRQLTLSVFFAAVAGAALMFWHAGSGPEEELSPRSSIPAPDKNEPNSKS